MKHLLSPAVQVVCLLEAAQTAAMASGGTSSCLQPNNTFDGLGPWLSNQGVTSFGFRILDLQADALRGQSRPSVLQTDDVFNQRQTCRKRTTWLERLKNPIDYPICTTDQGPSPGLSTSLGSQEER